MTEYQIEQACNAYERGGKYPNIARALKIDPDTIFKLLYSRYGSRRAESTIDMVMRLREKWITHTNIARCARISIQEVKSIIGE